MVTHTKPLTLTKGQTEQVEALWTLIRNQGTSVQEALFERLNTFFNHKVTETETEQHLYIKDSLHRAFHNMRQAEVNGEKEETLDEFLNDL